MKRLTVSVVIVLLAVQIGIAAEHVTPKILATSTDSIIVRWRTIGEFPEPYAPLPQVQRFRIAADPFSALFPTCRF